MPLAAALFAPAQSKVIEWIFGVPARAFHVNELIRLTGLGSASVQREIGRLFDAGLVTEERIGNVRRVRANPSSPVFAELTSLVQKTLGLVPAIAKALLPLADHIEFAAVYGSVAKRSEHADSDVDVMIVSDALSFAEVTAALAAAQDRLSRAINPTIYTSAEFAARRAQPDSFVNRVLAQTYDVVAGRLR
ncbi:MAG TPA: transcriptional regulator [Casimicrobium sp.]|jgi:predicted nucleotidyltransferase|nr:transcriptional regulator [Casimicrobium sp.]